MWLRISHGAAQLSSQERLWGWVGGEDAVLKIIFKVGAPAPTSSAALTRC